MHLKLGPRQSLDLDKRFSREKTEKSKLLQDCIKKGYIKVKKKTEKNENTSNYLGPLLDVGPNIDADEIAKKIKKDMKKEMKKIEDKISQPTNAVTKEDLTTVMEQILSKIGQKGIGETLENKEKDIEVDEKQLTKLHAKVVDKMTKDTKTGAMTYKKEEISDDISSNVDELSDLLG